jgi:hypothetical protein
MIPERGTPCDLCTPSFHYRLRCSCDHTWDEPAKHGPYLCPKCGKEHVVTDAEHDSWKSSLGGGGHV